MTEKLKINDFNIQLPVAITEQQAKELKEMADIERENRRFEKKMEAPFTDKLSKITMTLESKELITASTSFITGTIKTIIWYISIIISYIITFCSIAGLTWGIITPFGAAALLIIAGIFLVIVVSIYFAAGIASSILMISDIADRIKYTDTGTLIILTISVSLRGWSYIFNRLTGGTFDDYYHTVILPIEEKKLK